MSLRGNDHDGTMKSHGISQMVDATRLIIFYMVYYHARRYTIILHIYIANRGQLSADDSSQLQLVSLLLRLQLTNCRLFSARP